VEFKSEFRLARKYGLTNFARQDTAQKEFIKIGRMRNLSMVL